MSRYAPYMISRDMTGNKLPDGTDAEGKAYTRNLSFQPGYGELVNIVAGLQKDVKRINQAITLEGAQAYVDAVDKYGKKIRKNWTAHEEDITGPNGHPDGVKEVFVTDAKGNLRIINGYTLGKTTYPIRKAYRTLFNTPKERKETPFTSFKRQLYQINEGFDKDGQPYYVNNPGKDIGAEFAHLQPEITTKKLFKDFLFRPVYEGIKNEMKEQKVKLPPMTMAQLFNKGLRDSFYRHIQMPGLVEMLGADPAVFDSKTINKALRSKAYDQFTKALIKDILLTEGRSSEIQADIHILLGRLVQQALEGASDPAPAPPAAPPAPAPLQINN